MSHSLSTKSLAAHVADLYAVFENATLGGSHNALSLLLGDALAQVMSFVPSRKERRCLSAVSPQTRLDSEAMTVEGHVWRGELRVQVINEPYNLSCAEARQVLFVTAVTARDDSRRQQMMLSLWWARRCGLPVELSIDNTDNGMLALLGDALRSRVKRLTVRMRSPPEIAAGDATISRSTSYITVLASLLSFSDLHSLSIRYEANGVEDMLTAELAGALEVAASLPVVASKVERCKALRSLSQLAGSRLLRSLTVVTSGLRSLEGLGKYPMLETLTIANCPHLSGISAIADLPRLQEIKIIGCDLHSLEGFDRCVALKRVNVSGNRNLQSLSPLAGAPLLETIIASSCDIRSVQGLGSCAALTMFILTGNRNLQSLGDLSRAPCLQKVIAIGCGLRHIGEIGAWCALEEIHVWGNRDLQSLSGLAGAPFLEGVHARDCGIQDFTVLETCPKLSKVYKTDDDYSQ